MKKGYIQIYYGNGKGKTTAALGLAVRALGNGLKVCIIHFLKYNRTGEDNFFLNNSDITIKKYFIRNKICCKQKPKFAKKEIIEALDEIKEIIQKDKYDILILDELSILVYYEIITEEELLQILINKSDKLEIVITGRYVTKNIIKIADLVTEMKAVKHYYNKNIKARKGIEY